MSLAAPLQTVTKLPTGAIVSYELYKAMIPQTL